MKITDRVWQRSIIGVFLLFVLAGSAGYYYYEKSYLPAKQNTQLVMYTKKAIDAQTSFYSGDYATSITNLQTLIASAPNKTEWGRLQLLLASSYLVRNQNEDLVKSITILKQIINDYTIAPWVRALALNSIAAVVITKDSSFYALYFTDAPLNAYLPTSGSDGQKIQTAYLKILQLSDETFPNSFAEYTIAGNYYGIAVSNNGYSADKLPDIAKLMQRYVAEGDSLNDVALYAPSNVLFMQLYRALALASSGRILNSPSLGDREKAFQLALASADAYQKAGQDMAVPIMAAAVLKIHFFYANFLLRDFPGKRNDDIKTLLQPFAQADTNNSALGTLVLLNSVADNNFTKVQALKLAQISPDFKKFLQATGVSVK